MAKINFEIITPERTVYSAQADSITIPTAMGEITILPNHIPVISLLAPGELIVRQDKKEEMLAVSGGFIEVRMDNKVVVLSDTAELAAEIDLEAVEKAKKRAEKLMKEKQSSDTDYAALSANLERELARIKVGKKYKKLRNLQK